MPTLRGEIDFSTSSSILLQVGKNSSSLIQIVEYSGPSLSYYINKLKPMKVVQTSVTEAPTTPKVYGLQALVAAPEIEALNAPKIKAINVTKVDFSKPEVPAPQVEVYNDVVCSCDLYANFKLVLLSSVASLSQELCVKAFFETIAKALHPVNYACTTALTYQRKISLIEFDE
ncbi:hypothetical protein H5410_002927 [Solanum commersonii]|uniref:Uncharacterized protein n=1 Tax=Solanum commersonii TaxID=4109 RepID=A0A9J6B3P8_SOLCO|nr:hypothetical protein H5410_002927 [Solanum commersonii]